MAAHFRVCTHSRAASQSRLPTFSYTSFYSTHTNPTCGLYCNYAKRTLVPGFRRERIVYRNEQFQQGQYTQPLGLDDLRIHVNTTIDGFRTILSN